MIAQSIYSRPDSISASLLHAASGGGSGSDNRPIYIGDAACSFPGTLSSGLASLSARPEDSGQGWSAQSMPPALMHVLDLLTGLPLAAGSGDSDMRQESGHIGVRMDVRTIHTSLDNDYAVHL